LIIFPLDLDFSFIIRLNLPLPTIKNTHAASLITPRFDQPHYVPTEMTTIANHFLAEG